VGSEAEDGSGHGVVAGIAAGHLTSAAVDGKGRLFVWGCPYAEDGVQPSSAELRPRRATVVASRAEGRHDGEGGSSGNSGSGGGDGQSGVFFRSVGMGGYHTVAVTQVLDRWGQGEA
jgi:hypothetical protein